MNFFENLKKNVLLNSLRKSALLLYDFDDVSVIERKDGLWGVINKGGDEIVPFGKYDLIEPFYMGLARVKIGKVPVGKSENYGKYRWSIINIYGEEVVPVEYTELWHFHLKQKSRIRLAKDASYSWLNLYDIAPYPYNIETDNDGCIIDAEYLDAIKEDYLNDDIMDAFDGDSDAMCNID